MSKKYANPPYDRSDLTAVVQSTISELQRMGIYVKKSNEIHEYLLQFPDIMEATKRISKASRQRFPGAQLSLEIYRDPEIEDEYLVLYIRFREYDEPIRKRLLQGIEDIEAAHEQYLVGKQGWLLVTTDFQPAEGEGWNEFQLARIPFIRCGC